MIASVWILQVGHTNCVAHSINLIVQRSCDQIAVLTDIRNKTHQRITYFRSSTTAKEKLDQVQQQMGRPRLKLINEVPTRWNSTYHMLTKINDQTEPLWVSLASFKTDLTILTAQDCEAIEETLSMLEPFNQATVELSEEKKSLRIQGHSHAKNAAPCTSMQRLTYDHTDCNTTHWKPPKKTHRYYFHCGIIKRVSMYALMQ